MQPITAERVRELLHYDADTGEFTRRVAVGRHGCHRAGDAVGSKNHGGYFVTAIDGRKEYLHRLAFLWMTGRMPALHIDHINGDRGNNAWLNLRQVEQGVNNQNQRRARVDSLTGLKGVKPVGHRFLARLTVAGVTHYLGKHPTAEAAHAAYVAAKRRLHVGCTI